MGENQAPYAAVWLLYSGHLVLLLSESLKQQYCFTSWLSVIEALALCYSLILSTCSLCPLIYIHQQKTFMALKSPYDPEDQIYEHLVQSSDLAIPPEELPAMYILPSLPVRHQGKRETCAAFTGASIAEYHFPFIGRLLPEFIYYHQATPRGMYGRNVFQILQKKGYPQRASSAMGLPNVPMMRSISQPKAGGCQASPGSTPSMEPNTC